MHDPTPVSAESDYDFLKYLQTFDNLRPVGAKDFPKSLHISR